MSNENNFGIKPKKLNPPKPEADSGDKWQHGIGQQSPQNVSSVNVQMVPLDQIILDPSNPRLLHLSLDEIKNGPKFSNEEFDFNDEENQLNFSKIVESYFTNDPIKITKISEYLDLAAFAASIGSPEKLINPISVYLKDMNFHLIAGHRRTLAHYILGAKLIIARIFPGDPGSLQHNLYQWKENLDRKNLSLYEQISSIEKIINASTIENNTAITAKKLMSLLGLKKSFASYFLRVIKEKNAIPLFDSLIKEGIINSLEMAYYICTIEEEVKKNVFLEQIRKKPGITIKDLKKEITLLNEQAKDVNLNITDVNKFKTKKDLGLKISKKTDLKVLSEIMKILIVDTNTLNPFKEELQRFNLNTKKGILKLWERIYTIIELQRKKIDEES